MSELGIREGAVGEQPMQASKWIQVQLLLDADEMQDLFDHLGDFKIYRCGCVLAKGEGNISRQAFLDCYRSYVAHLKEGKVPPESTYSPFFTSILTLSSDCLFMLPLGEKQQMIRPAKPIIQLQSHEMDYSSVDGKFRSMVFGGESILWGLQLSYPQLYQNPETMEVEKVLEDPKHINTPLFRQLQHWVRLNTIPTPFLIDGHKTNVPMRLGKRCISWINQHPQLRKKGITVAA